MVQPPVRSPQLVVIGEEGMDAALKRMVFVALTEVVVHKAGNVTEINAMLNLLKL